MRRMMVLIHGKFQRRVSGRVLWVHSKSVQGHPKIIKATARETFQKEKNLPGEEPSGRRTLNN